MKDTRQKKSNNYPNERVVCFSLPPQYKKQLLFVSKFKNMTLSEICRVLITKFLDKNKISEKMLQYALNQILQEADNNEYGTR